MIKLIQIIKNEMIKMYYRKKMLIGCIVLIIALVATVISFNYNRGENGVLREQKSINSLKSKMPTTKKLNEKDNIQDQISFRQNSIQEYLNLKNDPLNWKKQLIKSTEKMENSNTTNITDFEREKLNLNIKVNEYLIKNNIKPIKDFSKSGLVFFSYYLNIVVMLTFIIVIFMTSDIVSNEYSLTTIKFLLTRPISKVQLIIGKFIAGATVVSLMVTIFDLIVYILGGLFFGFTSLIYPVSIEPKFIKSNILDVTFNKFIAVIPNSSNIIPFYKFLLENWILQILFIIVAVSFCIFISALVKNNVIAIVIPIFVYSFYNVILNTSFDNITANSMLSNFFLNLSDYPSIIDGSFVEHTGLYYINTLSAIGILILWLFVFIVLSVLTTKQKDVRI